MCAQLLEVFTLATIIVMFTLNLFLAAEVFSPLLPAPKGAFRCALIDVLVLLGLFGLAGAWCFHPEESVGDEIAGLAVLYGLLTAGWWQLVSGLNGKNVHDPLSRAVVLGILAPPVYCWPLVFSAINVVVFCFLIVPLLAFFLLIWAWSKVIRTVVPALVTPSRAMRRVPRPVLWIGVAILFAFTTPLATAPLWSGYTAPPIYYKNNLRRFRHEMRRTADIPAIQA